MELDKYHIVLELLNEWPTIFKKNINDHPIIYIYIPSSFIRLISNHNVYNVTSTKTQQTWRIIPLAITQPKISLILLPNSSSLQLNIFWNQSLRNIPTSNMRPIYMSKKIIGRIEVLHTDYFQITRQNIGLAKIGCYNISSLTQQRYRVRKYAA